MTGTATAESSPDKLPWDEDLVGGIWWKALYIEGYGWKFEGKREDNSLFYQEPDDRPSTKMEWVMKKKMDEASS